MRGWDGGCGVGVGAKGRSELCYLVSACVESPESIYAGERVHAGGIERCDASRLRRTEAVLADRRSQFSLAAAPVPPDRPAIMHLYGTGILCHLRTSRLTTCLQHRGPRTKARATDHLCASLSSCSRACMYARTYATSPARLEGSDSESATRRPARCTLSTLRS